MAKDLNKGKNKRCSDQLYVSGVPTKPGELIWMKKEGKVIRVKSRKQLTNDTTLIVTTGSVPSPDNFEATERLPEGFWTGQSNEHNAKASQAAKNPTKSITLSTHPHLRSRVNSSKIHIKERVSLGYDERTGRAVHNLASQVKERGGRALVVGGAVRDALWSDLKGLPMHIKDIDIEVYGIDSSELQNLLQSQHRVDLVGASFAVLKLLDYDIDVSLPRKDSRTGQGHKDFTVQADPFMSYEQAASRRDFTINALSMDPLTGEVIDPVGGLKDLQNKVLRHVSDAFSEDPLRVLRGAQFAARFAMDLAPETVELCRSLRPQAGSLAAERIWEETVKLLQKGISPKKGIETLDQVNWLDIHPELFNLKHVEQDPTWYPEGDVLEHTGHALDYWSKHLRSGDSHKDLVISLAIMCHDFGKATTTKFQEGKWRAIDHDRAGAKLTQDYLHRLNQIELAKEVIPYVVHHLAPSSLYADRSSKAAIRRLAQKVPSIETLVTVAHADKAGRPPLTGDYPAGKWLLEQAEQLNVLNAPMKNLVGGDFLISIGLKPGPIFRDLLVKAYEAQLEGYVSTKEEAENYLKKIVEETL